jgi:hypothetical protein
MVVTGKIGIETAAIILDITRADTLWNKVLKDDIIWDQWKLRLTKYQPFILDYDKAKFTDLILDFFRGDLQKVL